MSLNSALMAGVSGLSANAAAMAAISQNIANVNTVGYKRTESEFQTMVNGQANGASYSAAGVTSSDRQFVSEAGQLLTSTSATSLAITGDGFFVVAQKAEDLTPTDARLFTRAGAFNVDAQGYLKNTAGLYLQGWPVDADGNVSSDPSDLNRLTSINVGSVGGAAEATSRTEISANLRSGQTVSAEALAAAQTPPDAGAYDPVVNSMAMWDPETGDGVKPDFELSIPVSDSKGGQKTIVMSFLKSDTPNEWYAEVRVVPADDVVTGDGLSNGQIKTGVVAFTQDGRLDAAAMAALGDAALFEDVENAVLAFGASNGGAPGDGEFRWADDLGIAAQTLDFGMIASTGGLTQYDSASVVQQVLTNGTAFGNLTDVQIDEQGFVTAIFDNGVTRRIAQVALATFPSPDSLTAVDGNAYMVSKSSGTFNLKAPGSGGAGLLSSYRLEGSTVDLSLEFTALITTQRAYSASSRIITTADEMLQELLSIKR